MEKACVRTWNKQKKACVRNDEKRVHKNKKGFSLDAFVTFFFSKICACAFWTFVRVFLFCFSPCLTCAIACARRGRVGPRTLLKNFDACFFLHFIFLCMSAFSLGLALLNLSTKRWCQTSAPVGKTFWSAPSQRACPRLSCPCPLTRALCVGRTPGH